jgi:hypothetical protein
MFCSSEIVVRATQSSMIKDTSIRMVGPPRARASIDPTAVLMSDA